MQNSSNGSDPLEIVALLQGFDEGRRPDAESMEAVVAALTALVAQHTASGLLDSKAQASSLLATAVRIGVELREPGERHAGFLLARRQALGARDDAIAAATNSGFNDGNLSAYVRATDEAAMACLAAGEGDDSATGADFLADAAEYFGEAATGYGRLKLVDQASLARIKALRARSMRALRN